MSQQQIAINISGQDKPGVTAGLMAVINDHNCKIVDIGHAITHGLLSLSLLIEKTHQTKQADLEKALELAASHHQMSLQIKTLAKQEQNRQLLEKYIISCVSLSGISPLFLQDITSVLAKHRINIERIDNVSAETLVSLDIAASTKESPFDWNKIKPELISISNDHKTDLAMLSDDVWRRNKRLIVFDMDSTLIQTEVIVEMAKVHGVGDKVHEITERAMNGEIDFDQSLIERVNLLKGMPEADLASILQEIPLTAGVEDFICKVKSLGYKTAIISGGFNYFADAFKEKLGIDYAFSNELEIDKKRLTGRVKAPIVNAEKKALLLELLSQQENIRLEQVVAIGDGANDLPMLAKAGLGIAFHAKEIVKQSAKQHMSHGPMTSILYFLGIPESF